MEQPSLILSFYSFGVMLHKRDDDEVSEFPLDPAQVALSAKAHFDTGLLTPPAAESQPAPVQDDVNDILRKAEEAHETLTEIAKSDPHGRLPPGSTGTIGAGSGISVTPSALRPTENQRF